MKLPSPRSSIALAFALVLASARSQADPPDDAAAIIADATAPADDVTAPSLDASVTAPSLDASVTVADPTPPPPETPPAPGPARVASPSMPRLDVANYTLEARLDPQRHEVIGEGSLRWRNTSRVAVRDLWFHLYLNGFADERSVFMRTTGGEHRGNARGRYGRIDVHTLRLASGEDLLPGSTSDPAFPDDRSQLHVTLPHEVLPGAEITVAMTWTSVLPEVFARTGYKNSFHMAAQWFPKVAVLEDDGAWAHFAFHGNSEFYSDFGRYDVTLTVPRGWTVGATGQPVFTEHLADGDHHRFSASPVHDFAWTTWDHFRERRDESGDVALRVLYPPGLEHAAATTIECLRRAMPAYAHRYGSYPYPGLTVVIPPNDAEGAGGMEYPTLITTGALWWLPDGVRGTEYVTLHEYMHQYFYGLVASNENAWPFLDEGFTEYATAAGFEDLYGPGATFVDLPLLGARFDAFAYEAFGSASIEHLLPVGRSAASFPSFDSYGGHVYPRTATILRTAELQVGREHFRQAMRRYAERWRFRHPTPDDFFAAMTESLGEPIVDTLLRPALMEPLHLDYAIESVEARTVGSRHLGRVVVHREGNVTLPVDVLLEDARGGHRTVRWDGVGGWTEIPYEGAVALRSARVDPRGNVPLDERRINNARLADDQPVRSVMPAVARVAYWFGLLLQAVGP